MFYFAAKHSSFPKKGPAVCLPPLKGPHIRLYFSQKPPPLFCWGLCCYPWKRKRFRWLYFLVRKFPRMRVG